MTRTLLALVLLLFALQAQAGVNWSSLWHNADQHGEELLQRGDAAAAAREYSDPRRRAYAKLKAGDYAAAARDLAPFDDGDAHYNRGNALAHAGDLQGAIAAYDAALKRDPNNQDARHNRELVANALKQKPPQKKDSGGKPQDGKQDGQQDKDKDNDQAGQSGRGNNDQHAQSSAKNPAQKAQEGNPLGGNQPASARQDQRQKNGQTESRTAPQNSRKPLDQERNDADQARRDAAASLAEAKAGGKDSTGIGGNANDIQAESSSIPLNEKQLAKEQWLRSIPDDPGGLLRRKFLIEHMLRQQKAQP